MSANYKRLLKILEKWPIDKTKQGRDFGDHLRNRAKRLFAGDTAQGDNQDVAKQLDALERIANDTYNKRFPRVSAASATGLNREQCKQVLSSEFLDYITTTEKGVFDKVNPKSN